MAKAVLIGAAVLAAVAGILLVRKPKRRGGFDALGDRAPSRRTGLRALFTIYGEGIRAVLSHRRRDNPDFDALTRRRELAKVAVRVMLTVVRARFRALFARGARKTEIREAASQKAAQDVVLTMGQMKGLAMKMGQMGSYIMNVSGSAEAELVKLQAKVPPMPFRDVEQVLTEDLGAGAVDSFAAFSEEPLASASVGQVHRARLHDGRDVVVKVQYPGIRTAVVADLENFVLLYELTGLMGGGNYGAVMRDMGRALEEEIDYEKEAANQSYFAEKYEGHPFVKVPDVVPELSSKRVLTSGWVDGRSLYELSGRPQEELDRYGEIVYRFAFESILSGMFSGDPHPGNYLFMDDGRVCFLDFGFVGRLDQKSRDSFRMPLVGALERDPALLAAGLRAMGLLPEKGKSNPAKLWEETKPLLIGPIDEDREIRMEPAAFAAALKQTQKLNAEMGKMRKSENIPEWLTILMRYTAGTLAVLCKLHASHNWHRLARELVLAEPPSTEIGAGWGKRARRRA